MKVQIKKGATKFVFNNALRNILINKQLQSKISKVEKNWKSRNFSCGLWEDPPGQTWEGYVHEVDELLMVLEGELELEISGKLVHPKINEEILISAKAVHSVRNVGKRVSRWLYGYRK